MEKINPTLAKPSTYIKSKLTQECAMKFKSRKPWILGSMAVTNFQAYYIYEVYKNQELQVQAQMDH